MGSPRTNTKNAIAGNARAPLPTLFYWRVRPEVNIRNSSRVVMLLWGAGMTPQNAISSSGGTVDASGSNPGVRKGVRVQISPGAP